MSNFAQESFTDSFFDEVDRLTRAHWLECAMWQDKIVLDVDRAKYKALEAQGVARLYTYRIDDIKLVGYMAVLTGKHLHYKADAFAMVDVLFMDAEVRKGLSAIKFMKYVENEAKVTGAAVMTYHIKTFLDYPAIFERLGFKPIETIYAKLLKE